MIYFNRDKLRDKISACWIGKNIGGTVGGPYEGKRDLLDIKGFATKKGEAMPNDDLDLQLVWLRAVSELGIEAINSKVLGEYWLNYVAPHWNEYGVCKVNMRNGFMPPFSGAGDLNEKWQHSNGAWIRTEIWACLNPGNVEKAIRLAFEDASVDHGFGEGSYAAIFIAAIESAAFIINDINVLIDIGLSKIPEDCRVSKLVRLVRKAYADGVDWKTARQMIVEANDLGWFMAPNNIAFAVLGLLYGNCDFKQSMILAVNCADDTDCTGATVGALLGIMYGTDAIPEDWKEHIGDKIVSAAIVYGHGRFPVTCTELTDYVMHILPSTLRMSFEQFAAHRTGTVIHDGDDNFSELDIKSFYGTDFVDSTFNRSQYSFTAENIYYTVLTEFSAVPKITPGGSVTCKITVLPNIRMITGVNHFSLQWFLPEGWKASGDRNLFASRGPVLETASTEVTITAGENVEANNKIVLKVTSPDRLIPTYVTITVLG